MSLWSALDDGIVDAEQARAIALPAHQARIARARRWVAHFDNRLAYERAMLAEIGRDRGRPGEAGEGRGVPVLVLARLRQGWSIIQKVNRVSRDAAGQLGQRRAGLHPHDSLRPTRGR